MWQFYRMRPDAKEDNLLTATTQTKPTLEVAKPLLLTPLGHRSEKCNVWGCAIMWVEDKPGCTIDRRVEKALGD